MNYPFWDVDIGYGILMGVIAVVHVFISHFAIGGGLYLVIAETSARRKNDHMMLEFLQKLSKFFVLTSVVMGALTGVAIWFIIGLLNPAATEVLIHNFVWAWATEWTFFLVEICAALIYYYGWKTMSAKNHIIVGWIYFGSAWLSLVAIAGIISFMMSPGEWLSTGDFWDGFLNPTYFSSVVLRTGICIMLAGVYALFIASRYKADDFKKMLIRKNAVWGITGLAISIVSLVWYMGSIPEPIKEAVMGTHLTPVSAMNASYINAILLGLVLIIFGLIIPKRFNLVIGILAMAFAFSWFGEYEWTRESLRKPYVIYDYMYANAVELADTEAYQTDGYLSKMKFQTDDKGADLFRRACRSCHTIDGYKALKPAYDGTDETFIAQTIRGTYVMPFNMPEFLGTEEEAQLIGAYLYTQVDQRHPSEIYNLSGVELGKKVYDTRCGRCHVIGGFNDKSESIIVDVTAEDLNDILDMAGDFADEMPEFTGDEVEREALIAYLLSLQKGDN